MNPTVPSVETHSRHAGQTQTGIQQQAQLEQKKLTSRQSIYLSPLCLSLCLSPPSVLTASSPVTIARLCGAHAIIPFTCIASRSHSRHDRHAHYAERNGSTKSPVMTRHRRTRRNKQRNKYTSTHNPYEGDQTRSTHQSHCQILPIVFHNHHCYHMRCPIHTVKTLNCSKSLSRSSRMMWHLNRCLFQYMNCCRST